MKTRRPQRLGGKERKVKYSASSNMKDSIHGSEAQALEDIL